jgi:hypothetical protein
MVDLSVVANLRAPLAASRGIIVSFVGFRRRVEQFALLTPTADGTAFNRGSFSPLHRGATRGPHHEGGPPAVADLLRPSAEEA